MALFDDQWFTGVQTAATSLLTAVAGFLGGWAVVRRKYSADSAEIAKDRGQVNWVQQLLEEGRPADARTIGRLEATVEAYKERIADLESERAEKVGACEERVRSLSEQVLDAKLANGRLFAALAAIDKPAAERLLLDHLRPGPPGPGDEPP
jgi:hypothetical protein